MRSAKCGVRSLPMIGPADDDDDDALNIVGGSVSLWQTNGNYLVVSYGRCFIVVNDCNTEKCKVK